MAWTTPITFTATTLTAAQMNTNVRDNTNALHVFNGANTTEQTTASGASVDLVTVTLGTSITVGTPFRIMFNFRKTTGAAAAAGFGLKINSTLMYDGAASTEYCAKTSAANAAENGICVIDVAPRSTNYLAGTLWIASAYVNAAGGAPISVTPVINAGAVIPNATITSVIIRANSGSASITAAVKEVYVVSWPLS